jgi:TRAP-type C4-dicarboxylate transport system permease small subunit
MNALTAFIDKAMAALERVLAVAFFIAVALNFINVVGRYVFSWSLIWSDEIQVFIMVWMTFLGAAIVTWRRGHLRMDVLFAALPARIRHIIKVIEGAVALVVCGFVAWQGYAYASRMLMLGRQSDMAHVPMWIPHSAVPLGFGLITLLLVARIAAALHARRKRAAAAPGSAPLGAE